MRLLRPSAGAAWHVAGPVLVGVAAFLAAMSPVAGSSCRAAPADPVSHSAEPCGTWIGLSRDGNGRFQFESLARPADGPLVRDSDRFRVHYPDGSYDAYADSILSAAEKAYAVLIDTLGFLQPPSDAPNGGDGRIDIYVQSSSGFPYLGVTYPETWVGSPYDNSYTSYMELTDTMGIDLLLTTTAHEFFHTVQIGYDRDENISFLELLSVWCEDRVYDEINAYRRHLPKFFSSPHRALFGYTYSNVVWAFYLTENYGDGVLRDILEACGAVGGNNMVQSTGDVLAGFGTDMMSEVCTFHGWNFFTGVRDDGRHYEEGADFPLVFIEQTVDCLPAGGLTNSTHKVGTMGCNYFEIRGDHYTDSLRLDIVPEYYASSILASMRFTGDGFETDRTDYAQFTISPPPVMDASWQETDSLLLLYTIESSAQSGNSFGMSASHAAAPPPAQPYVLVLDRDGCRRPFDGINDDFSPAAGEDFPYAAALAADSILFALTDSIPAALSYCEAIVIVGGYNAAGPLFSTAELETLTAYMDRGGDIYLESNRLGEWMDPLQGEPAPAEEAFWSCFGCNYVRGDTMTTGNVSSWHTEENSSLGAFAYAYDAGGDPDNFVGELVPTLAETLAVDQSGRVRATVMKGANDSYRIHSTVLLGGSTPLNPESSRGRFLFRIFELLESSVPALAVTFLDVRVDNDRILFDGRIEGYNGEPLSLLRLGAVERDAGVPVPLVIGTEGASVSIHAVDSPPPGNAYTYRLYAGSGAYERILWQGEAGVIGVPLSIQAISPNPSSGAFRMFVTAPRPEPALLRIYDVGGRLVFREARRLHAGDNEIAFDGRDLHGRRLSSGVYFVRLDGSGRSFHKKLVIVR